MGEVSEEIEVIHSSSAPKSLSSIRMYYFAQKLQVNDKLEETCKRTSDSVGQASKQKQGNLKLKKASSSVVLIKSIPTSKKNGTGIAKNFLKPSHRQYQAQ